MPTCGTRTFCLYLYYTTACHHLRVRRVRAYVTVLHAGWRRLAPRNNAAAAPHMPSPFAVYLLCGRRGCRCRRLLALVTRRALHLRCLPATGAVLLKILFSGSTGTGRGMGTAMGSSVSGRLPALDIACRCHRGAQTHRRMVCCIPRSLVDVRLGGLRPDGDLLSPSSRATVSRQTRRGAPPTSARQDGLWNVALPAPAPAAHTQRLRHSGTTFSLPRLRRFRCSWTRLVLGFHLVCRFSILAYLVLWRMLFTRDDNLCRTSLRHLLNLRTVLHERRSSS